MMSTPLTPAGPRGRETRLLLVTIAISVGVLLLLARYRFPDEAADRPVEAAPAPLERLAAQATYDELASIMADLERRIAPRLWMVRAGAANAAGSLAVAPRLTPDRAVALMETGERLESATPGAAADIVAEDLARGLAVLRVPAVDDGAVSIRTGAPRPGPRYVGVVEASAAGPTLRPVYVGRMQLAADPRTGAEQLTMTALQHALPRGAAIFTLDGLFVGLVRDGGDPATVLTAEFLRSAADGAQASPAPTRGSLGIEVAALTPALARATGADRGVIVTHIAPGGPAAKLLQSGDVIQSLDGTAVSTVEEFQRQEAGRVPGASATVTGLRRGSPLDAVVTAVDAAAETAGASGGHGLIGRSVPGVGIEVVTVDEPSAAAVAGLEPGDLIVAVDGQANLDMAGFARHYRAADAGGSLLLAVQRGQRHHVFPLEKR